MTATLAELVATSRAVRATPSRLEKQAHLSALFARLEAEDLALAVSYLSGEIPQGALGVGWRTIATALDAEVSGGEDSPQLALFPASDAERPAAAVPPAGPLLLVDVDRTLARIAASHGPGSAARARRLLRTLVARVPEAERGFLVGLLTGELRQGALRAVVREAVARALEIPPEAIARAEMFGGDLARVAAAVRRDGSSALLRFAPRPMVPVAPMLARAAESVEAALAGLGPAAAETKLDGVRIQLHREDDRVRIFTRQLRDVSPNLPEVVAIGRELSVDSVILDGEAVAFGPDGRPLPFQETMSRVGREDAAAAQADRPITVLFFDLLYLDGQPFIDRPYAERREALAAVTQGRHLVPRTLLTSPADLERFFGESLAAGHEGAVVKALASPYAAGKRGGQWRKLKTATTLDLVILAAEWGHGRRRGFLSNLHLGARDAEDSGRFWMLGKTFKGLTDEMLRTMTADLLALAAGRRSGADPSAAGSAQPGGHVVRVPPIRVVEIAFDGLQRSPRYDSGLALRFARVKRFRPDKSPEEATTIDEVYEIHGARGGEA